MLQESSKYKTNLSDWISFIITKLNICDLLKDSELLPDEWENIENLKNEVGDEKYNDYNTSDFAKIGKPDNQITISTRHSSKGLEFEVIIMMGMEEDHFPGWWTKNNPNELLESNRICFVCVSRAKRVCILMHSNYYDEYDKRYDDTICKRYYPSRYLLELKRKFNTATQL